MNCKRLICEERPADNFSAGRSFALDKIEKVVYDDCTSTVNTLNTQGGDTVIQLNYRDARPIYSQITDGIRDQILAGVLRNGDKLPSVRDLAGKLAINPNTIQRAYRELEMQGWIATVPGKGCFVCGVPAVSDREQKPLLECFDKTVAALLAMGVSKEALLARLDQGGDQNA